MRSTCSQVFLTDIGGYKGAYSAYNSEVDACVLNGFIKNIHFFNIFSPRPKTILSNVLSKQK